MLVHRKRPRIVLGLLIPTSKSWMERDTASVNYFTLEHNVITQTGVRPAPSESSSLIMGPPSSHTNIIVTLLSLKVENQIFASVNYFTLEHNVLTQTGVRPAPSESSSLIMGPPSSHTNIIATLLSLKFCPRFALSRLVANYVEIFRPEDIYF